MGECLTFAIPFYSGRHFLSLAIESVLRQEDPNWELVICDDSPRDEGVIGLIDQFDDPRIRYHKNTTTLGLAENWNRCLAEAKTELVTILHADDMLLKNYCGLMRDAARKYSDAVGLFCDATIINDRGKKIASVPDLVKRFLRPRSRGPLCLTGPLSLATLLHGNFIMCPTMCYRVGLLRDRRFDRRWQFVVDLDLFTRLLMEEETLVGLPDTAYSYRRHNASATAMQTQNVNRFTEEIALYNQLAEIGRIRGWPEVTATAQRKRIIWMNLLYCIGRDAASLRFGDAKRKALLLSRTFNDL